MNKNNIAELVGLVMDVKEIDIDKLGITMKVSEENFENYKLGLKTNIFFFIIERNVTNYFNRKNLKKGSLIKIEGSMTNDYYYDKDTNTHYGDLLDIDSIFKIF